MILECLVVTKNADDAPNVSPMGPLVTPVEDDADPLAKGFVLRPFQSSRTYANLLRHGAGVLHVTDNVMDLARAAVNAWSDEESRLQSAETISGWTIRDACRAYEFEVVAIEPPNEIGRASMTCAVRHVERRRDMVGLSRAKHAVVEAAILATRVGLLPRQEIEAELDKLLVLVHKTGGPQEHAAIDLLVQHVQQADSLSAPTP